MRVLVAIAPYAVAYVFLSICCGLVIGRLLHIMNRTGTGAASGVCDRAAPSQDYADTRNTRPASPGDFDDTLYSRIGEASPAARSIVTRVAETTIA